MADQDDERAMRDADTTPAEEKVTLKTPTGEIKLARTTRSAPVNMQHG